RTRPRSRDCRPRAVILLGAILVGLSLRVPSDGARGAAARLCGAACAELLVLLPERESVLSDRARLPGGVGPGAPLKSAPRFLPLRARSGPRHHEARL